MNSIASLALLGLASVTIDDADSPESLQLYCFNAVVQTSQVGGGTGTGFFIHSAPDANGLFKHWVATAYHCVDGEGDIMVHTVAPESSPFFKRLISAKLVAFDEQCDIAILVLSTSEEHNCLKIGHLTDVQPPFAAITIGCTGGAYPTIWDDAVVGIESLSMPKYWKVHKDSLPGRSGGPLIGLDFHGANYGCVLGVCTRRDGTNGYYSRLAPLRKLAQDAGVPVSVLNGPNRLLPTTDTVWLLIKLLLVCLVCAFTQLRSQR